MRVQKVYNEKYLSQQFWWLTFTARRAKIFAAENIFISNEDAIKYLLDDKDDGRRRWTREESFLAS